LRSHGRKSDGSAKNTEAGRQFTAILQSGGPALGARRGDVQRTVLVPGQRFQSAQTASFFQELPIADTPEGRQMCAIAIPQRDGIRWRPITAKLNEVASCATTHCAVVGAASHGLACFAQARRGKRVQAPRCSRNCDRGGPLHMPLRKREGGTGPLIREPGDLPMTVVRLQGGVYL